MILYMRTALVLAHLCKEVKRNAYTTLVRPSVEYASAVWDPYTRNQTNQLEQVQRRAAKFVNNNFYNREPEGVFISVNSGVDYSIYSSSSGSSIGWYK
jgi:hypothetical protein